MAKKLKPLSPHELDQLVRAFYGAVLFLKDRCEHHGWRTSSNFLREYVRCSTRLSYSNTHSPLIYRKLLEAHPELAPYIPIKPLKKPPQPTLFK